MKKLCLAVSALAFNFGVYLLLPELPVASASGPAQEKEESAEKEPKGQLTLKQQWVRRETFLSLGSYYGVVFSRDSARFALGTSNGKVLVYGNERGEEPLVIDAEKYVVKLCFTPDGIKILSLGDYPLGSGGKAPKLWSLESKECVWTPTPYSAYCGDFCFSPDGSLLATYGVDYKPVVYSIRIWDVKTKTHMQTLKTYIVSKMAFTPDGKKVAFCMQKPGGRGYEIVFWDVAGQRTGPILQGLSKEIAWMWFSKDGKELIAATRRNGVQVWDWAAGRLLYTLPIHERGAETGAVQHLAFSPERNWLAEILEFTPKDRIMAIWSLDKREKILEGNQPISFLALSPDGRWLVMRKGFDFGVWQIIPKAK